jgi:hypothetical protein
LPRTATLEQGSPYHPGRLDIAAGLGFGGTRRRLSFGCTSLHAEYVVNARLDYSVYPTTSPPLPSSALPIALATHLPSPRISCGTYPLLYRFDPGHGVKTSAPLFLLSIPRPHLPHTYTLDTTTFTSPLRLSHRLRIPAPPSFLVHGSPESEP